MTPKDVALSLDLASNLGKREQVIASYRDGLLAPVRRLCAERIARAPNPTDNAFDAGLVCMARQVLDLLGKEET